MNTVQALWMKSPNDVSEEEYNEFYQFVAKAYDNPLAKVCEWFGRSSKQRQEKYGSH